MQLQYRWVQQSSRLTERVWVRENCTRIDPTVLLKSSLIISIEICPQMAGIMTSMADLARQLEEVKHATEALSVAQVHTSGRNKCSMHERIEERP